MAESGDFNALTRLFALPTSALIACWLKVDTGDGKSVIAERLFDLSSEADRDYLEGATPAGTITVEVENTLTGESKQYTITVDSDNLAAFVRDGLNYLHKLPHVDGTRALNEFTAISNKSRQQYDDLQQAWDALTEAVHTHAKSFFDQALSNERRERARERRFYWFARTLQIVAAIPFVGPWVVALIVPCLVIVLLISLGVLGETGDLGKGFAGVAFGLSVTLWTGYLDHAGIVKILLPIPFVSIPLWGAGILLTLAALGLKIF